MLLPCTQAIYSVVLDLVSMKACADRPKISSSASAYDVLLQQWSFDKFDLLEEFKVLLMNRSNRVLGIVNISQGGIAEL